LESSNVYVNVNSRIVASFPHQRHVYKHWTVEPTTLQGRPLLLTPLPLGPML
jgi:hypothetical protein